MGHREQAQFDRAQWKLPVLIAEWSLQIVFMLCLMGLFAYRLADTIEFWQDSGHTFNVPTVLIVWESTNVGLNLIALILTFVEIAKYASETLTPFSMLFTQVLKVTCGLCNLALDIVVHVEFPQGHWSIVGLAIGCGLVFSSLLPLWYSIRVYRRVSKFDEYSHPTNTKGYGFADDDSGLGNVSTGYMSQGYRLSEDAAHPSLSKHGSSTTTREIGADGNINLDPLGAKRASHPQERDGRFDDFLKKHSSSSPPAGAGGAGVKSAVDRTLAQEFGWGEGSPVTMTPSSSTTQTPTSSVGAVGSGVVKTGVGMPANSRSISYEAQLVRTPDEKDHAMRYMKRAEDMDEAEGKRLLDNGKGIKRVPSLAGMKRPHNDV